MKKNRILWGIGLILVGAYFLAVELNLITQSMLRYLLPVGVLVLALYLQIQYYREGCTDTAKPCMSGLFIGLSVIFFFCVKDGWKSFLDWYPLMLLGMSAGIAEEIISRKGRSGSWLYATVLASVGLVLLFGIQWHDIRRFGIPVALIAAGVSVILKSKH